MKIIYLLLFSVSFFGINTVIAQEQKIVTPGKYKNSFVLSWEKSDTVSKYEYVVSDNPECFGGCVGDTKNATVFGNEATVFPKFENKTYYWKVRPIVQEGDSTLYWSAIHSFETNYPEEQKASTLATLFPIPNYANQLTLRIDGSMLQNNESLKAIVYDNRGNNLIEFTITHSFESRFIDFVIPIESLSSGHYSLSIISDAKGKVQQLKFFKP